MALSDDIIDGFNTTSRYLDDILKFDYVYFDKLNMVSQIYHSEIQLWIKLIPLIPKPRFRLAFVNF